MKNNEFAGFRKSFLIVFPIILLMLSGCSKNNDQPPFYTSDYVVFAWNDLGMHCLNPSYDKAVIDGSNR